MLISVLAEFGQGLFGASALPWYDNSIATRAKNPAGHVSSPIGDRYPGMKDIAYRKRKFWFLCVVCLSLGACGRTALVQSTLVDPGGEAAIAGPIALGAVISPQWNLEMQGSGAPAISLVSATPDVLQVDGHQLIGRSPGVSAVMVATSDGTVLDFIHLWVVEPTRLVMESLSNDLKVNGPIDGVVQLVVGEILTLAPAAYADGQRLFGMMEMEWHLSEPAVEILRTGSRGRRRLLARTAGQSTLTVRVGELTTTLDVVVVP